MSRPLEILLVEDSPSDRFLAMDALTEANIPTHVHVVKDGIEALDFVRRLGSYSQAPRPDLILLDLNLPRKSGREVLAELKGDRNLSTIQVIVLAAPGGDANNVLAYPQHADSYVSKPIDVEQFCAVIQVFKHFWSSVGKLSPELSEKPVPAKSPSTAHRNAGSQDG
jgi:chemotaxis family two-component system response regulator Rcp1